MRKFLKNHHTRIRLIALLAGIMTMIILTLPVLAEDLTPEQKLARAAELSAQATELAATARETGNIEMAQEAMALAGEASNLLNEVATYAASAGNTELAQSAMNGAATLATANAQIMATAQYFIQTGTDPAVVNAANQLLVQAGEAQTLNDSTMDLAMASGAKPPSGEGYQPPAPPAFEIPVNEEPPIQDTGAASSV